MINGRTTELHLSAPNFIHDFIYVTRPGMSAMAHQNVWRISVRNALNRVRGVMPGNLISFFMMREKEFASAAISTRDYVRGLEGILILGSGGVSLSGAREFCIGRDFLEIRAFWFGDALSPLSPIHAQMGMDRR